MTSVYTLGRIGLNLRGEYNAAASYEKLDVVSHNGSSYAAKDSVSGVVPTDPTHWMLLAEGLALPESKRILDKLCRRESQSGAIVEGRWAEGYPLDYRVDVAARQSGSGDPSPENVRPIAGADAVHVARCGINLADCADGAVTKDYYYHEVCLCPMLPPGNYILRMNFALSGGNGERTIKIGAGTQYSFTNGIADFYQQADGDKALAFTIPDNEIMRSAAHLWMRPGAFSAPVNYTAAWKNVMIVPAASGSAGYAPYSGSTHAIALPETCYGGYIEGGKYVQTHRLLLIDGQQTSTSWVNSHANGQRYCSFDISGAKSQNADAPLCNRYTPADWSNSDGRIYITGNSIIITDSRFTSVAAANELFRANPVQIVYKLAAPIVRPLAMPTLCALDGQTTLYADSGAIAVSGAADPRADYEKLAERVAALENA